VQWGKWSQAIDPFQNPEALSMLFQYLHQRQRIEKRHKASGLTKRGKPRHGKSRIRHYGKNTDSKSNYRHYVRHDPRARSLRSIHLSRNWDGL